MPKRILLVEDAPQVANILVSKLTREGHAVTWRRDRNEALEAVRGGEMFDLTLLSTDLNGQRNAWQLLAELLAASPTPVVMLLQNEEAGLKTQALVSGARDVIIKPFKPTVVAKQVKELLAL